MAEEELEFERLQQVTDETELKEMLDSGWKLVETVKVQDEDVFILGWPAKVLEKAAEEKEKKGRPPQLFKGVVSLLIGLFLIWFLGLTERGFLVQTYTEMETALIMLAIVTTVYGLSQLYKLVPQAEAEEKV
jgi:hypothetical protein